MSKRGRKRRHEDSESSDADDAVAKSLAAYGERFMQMFEDAGDAAPSKPNAPASSSDSQDEGASASGESSDQSPGSGNSDSEGEESEDAGEASPEFVFDGRRMIPAGSGGVQRAPPADRRVSSSAAAFTAKHERRRFMSPKAAVVSPGSAAGQPVSPEGRRGKGGKSGGRGSAPATAGTAAAPGGVDPTSKAEFQRMQTEVLQYGATALDRKSKKKFDAESLARMGAKAQKGPRISAAIGVGMAKKQAQRAARALEEAIQSGMVKAKGLGKKRRAEERGPLDRGLNEDGGAFRGGVLRMKGPKKG